MRGQGRVILRNKIEQWLSRASNTATLWAALPSSVLAVVSAYLSQSVASISRFGAWGWLMAGLLAFLISSIAFSLIAKTGLWKVEARRRAQLEADSSPFDPMAATYEGKRLYLRDLAPAGRSSCHLHRPDRRRIPEVCIVSPFVFGRTSRLRLPSPVCIRGEHWL